ncbi:gamma-glutamyltransferase [Thermosynechococcus sp. QKsg1]|uniref:gamma-glutamyltransferase n=1 Tax=Thermosynechococcus sp. QKsg1 TaxID=3074130 RepID=UPI002877C692|nr:gamma-glutamyltransferase [Thermosynechococcus sp. QKsg1]WNC87505.1 gamma-glutamyltransferase [Thermosynechococcus sp. QKsg1]
MEQGFTLGKVEQWGRSPFLAIVLAVTFFAAPPAPAQTISQRGMVTAAQPAAAKIGRDILKAGGNAVDAAVATAFMIAVVEPYAAGIGGGGFALVYHAQSQTLRALDFRERASLQATPTMYLNAKGEVIPRASLDGVLAAGTPGTVAGLAALHQRYGQLPWSQVVAPAIQAAQQGFAVTPRYQQWATMRQAVLQHDATAARIFLRDGQVPPLGTVIQQLELAKTLGAIARDPRSFYEGWIARAIAEFMAQQGGKITLEDLRTYTPVWREPICGTYRAFQVCSMPLPSAGGVALVQMLNLWQLLPPASTPSDRGHYLASVMQIAYADRARYLGDSDFVPVPVTALTHPRYAQQRVSEILPRRARPQRAVSAATPIQLAESDNTSHLNVVDAQRNAVSLTFTINGPFGAGVVVPQTGILLNNEMDDFAIAPNQPNLFGVVGIQSENAPLANGIEPGKRPLSSMSPTIVLKDHRLNMVLGSPGGSRIITTVLQLFLNVVDLGQDAATAVARPRIHQQWAPDTLFVEPTIPSSWIQTWQQWGYRVEQSRPWGNASLIRVLDQGQLEGAADPRGEGAAMGW